MSAVGGETPHRGCAPTLPWQAGQPFCGPSPDDRSGKLSEPSHVAPASPDGHASADKPDALRRELDRRLCLAARSCLSRGRRPRDPLLPGGRERMVRALHGAAPAADRKPARGAESAHQGRRQLGSGARGRIRVPLAILCRRAVSDLVSPPAGWRRTGRDLGRGAACSGQELFQPAHARCQPGQSAPGVHDRRGRLRALSPSPAGSRDWQRARGPCRQHLGHGRVGRGWPHASLCRAQRQPAAVPRTGAPTRRGPQWRRRAVRGVRPGVLRLDRENPQPALLADLQRHARNPRGLPA